MRKLVALASLNERGTLDEDVMDAMVALAQKYALDNQDPAEASAADTLEPVDAAGEQFNGG